MFKINWEQRANSNHTQRKIFIKQFWTPWMWYSKPAHIVRVVGVYTAVMHFLIIMYCVDLMRPTDFSIPIGLFFESNSEDIASQAVLIIVYCIFYEITTVVLMINGLQSRLYMALPWLILSSLDCLILIVYQLGTFSYLTMFPKATLSLLCFISYDIYCVWAVMSCFMRLTYRNNIEAFSRELEREEDFRQQLSSFRRSSSIYLSKINIDKSQETIT